MLDELAGVLSRPKLDPAFAALGRSFNEVLIDYRQLVTLVSAKPLAEALSRDPDDDHVIACACAAHADFIVSGDKDLLVLGSAHGIAIHSAASIRDVLGSTDAPLE